MPEDKILLTKQEVARRQLDTAIHLWFDNQDPVSIHTLCGAVHRVLHDVAEHQGVSSVLFSRAVPQESRNRFRGAETFFKHAKDDPEGTFNFYPEFTTIYLYVAVDGYRSLYEGLSRLMNAYLLTFALLHPRYFRGTEFLEIFEKEIPVASLRSLPRSDLLAYFI